MKPLISTKNEPAKIQTQLQKTVFEIQRVIIIPSLILKLLLFSGIQNLFCLLK